MPESPEIFIISDFLNKRVGNCDVIKVEKSPLSKNEKCDLSVFDNKRWKLESTQRGKEMIIKLSCELKSHSIKVNFAKIGSLEYFELDKIDKDYFDKRGMLRFYTDTHVYFISDFTRYTLWRWSDSWDETRSPDVYVEHNDWRDYLYKHRKIKYFDRPIFDIITDQRFFNGIGNFARSEILTRVKFSPFTHFNEVLQSDELRNDFFIITKEVIGDIIRLGGMQFKHWVNPFGVMRKPFNQWVRCYNKYPAAFYIKDSKGSKFWFKHKWLKEYAIWMRNRILKSDTDQDTRLLEKIYKKNIK